jgi:ribosome-associated protein
MHKPNLDSNEKAEQIVSFADDIKAERIETLDVRQKTSVADYFIVCTGNSDTHVRSIAERVEERLRELGIRPLRTEVGDAGWVLQDYGDVVFHVMREERRQFYDLEALWTNAQADQDLIE